MVPDVDRNGVDAHGPQCGGKPAVVAGNLDRPDEYTKWLLRSAFVTAS
jgi:hypothetical protein